ncbi:hypothetical protein [Croceicoccus sp. YJ47]|uniref:hypothetical protein n=1 Tax=Croceicoccus sp. YJ47 TaxID=2798724 RepID=UPI001921478F|nr:hypothetical protein [Croceicoccus sp. YJ47]QQN73178.1 hypothetical protein JD971_09885 [Croceicoccus sp. YJ47]
MTLPPLLARIVARVGLTGLLLAIAIFIAAFQSVQLGGMRIGPIAVEGWRPKAVRLAQELKAVAAAQDAANARARKDHARAEAAYRQLAQRIDDNADAQTPEAMAAADRYIAAHRVRAKTADCPPGGTFTPAGDRGAGHAEAAGRPAELDAPDHKSDGDMVVVSAADVRICTSNTLRAEAAHDWALAIEASSAKVMR